MKEIMLYARRDGEPDWMEQLITSTSDPEHLKKAKQWARKQGFVSFRESVFDWSAPDFTKTTNS